MSDSEPIFEPLSRADDPWRATSVRPLAKLLAFPAPVWVIAEDETLAFLSAACGQWLGVAPHDLLGRSVTRPSEDPLDAIARALAPPARGHNKIQTAHAHPPANDGQLPSPCPVTFIPLATENDLAHNITPAPRPLLAIGRSLTSRELTDDNRTAMLVDLMRRQLAGDSRRSEAPIVLGGSIWAQRLRRQVDLAAASHEHVILIGGSASAAASIARLIESKSRSDKATSGNSATELLKVDAALMDAELFDATTGEVVARMLERDAPSAALLVEQIDQMPLDAQTRLELLMRNHRGRVRVYATSQAPATQLIAQLVPTLAYELGAWEIQLPTLNSRPEDIPLIATTLLHRRHLQGETPADQIGRETLDRLVLYAWPGDYDELEEAIRHAARQCRTETLRVEHLPLAIRTFGTPRSTELGPAKSELKANIQPLDQALADAERQYILAALRHAKGNRAAAARLLDISRPRLLRRIDQLNIVWPPQDPTA